MKKSKYICLLLLFIVYILFIYQICLKKRTNKQLKLINISGNSHPLNHSVILKSSISDELLKPINFEVQTDTLAFLHIQKTSGTHWMEAIRKHVQVLLPDDSWANICQSNKRSSYFYCNPVIENRIEYQALFWDKHNLYNCDIHAGYSELKRCISKDKTLVNMRKFHLITMLRNPIERYISEYEHVKRGATWSKSVRSCFHIPLNIRKCYQSQANWSHATWYDFLNCEYNLANNRQVRMLADYNELGCDILNCWTKSENCSNELKKQNEEKIYESAKKTLISLSFFGLTEYQELSRLLFEKTFKNKLRFDNTSQPEKSKVQLNGRNEFMNLVDVIFKNNQLDIRLYDFATELFFARINYMLINDTFL